MADPESELAPAPRYSPSAMSGWLLLRRRYLVYLHLLLVIYTECCCRFALPVAMLGGMTKTNCSDPTDPGELCWSEATKANVLGCFFYGYSAQMLTGWIAARYTGFPAAYRTWLSLSAIIQALYPFLAVNSVPVLTATQALRGFASGIMWAYTWYMTSTWVLGREYKVFIAVAGSVMYLADGTGGLLVAQVMRIGWRYFFYLSAMFYLAGLILNLILVKDSPEDSWFLGEEEKSLYILERQAVEENNPKEAEGKSSLWGVLKRPYVWAFFIYVGEWSMIYYSTFSVIPFYLRDVFGLDHITISYIMGGFALLLTVSSLAASSLLQKMKSMPWIRSRMILTLGPLFVHGAAFTALSFVDELWAGIVLLGATVIGCSTIFSGSIATMNFEMDPENAPFIYTIINNQLPGFLGPLLMTLLTAGDSDSTPRERWARYFFTNVGLAVLAGVAIVTAYLIHPDEWKPSIGEDSQKETGDLSDTVVIANKGVV